MSEANDSQSEPLANSTGSEQKPSSPYLDIGSDIRLLGTAHVSGDSVAAVRHHIEEWNPDIIAVELCESRYKALVEGRRLDQEGLRKVIKEGKAPLVLVQSMLAAEQRKLGLDEGQQPGAELLEAVRLAEERELRVELVDRDIQTTLRRAWRRMKLRERFRLLWGLLSEEDEDEDDLPELGQLLEDNDLLSQLMDELRQVAPGAGSVLVDERDAFLAGKIGTLRGEGKILAVVGAGHLKGIENCLQGEVADEEELHELATVPNPNPLWKGVTWGIPIAVLGLLGYLLWTGDRVALLDAFTMWAALNAGLAALFCLLARGHPLAILTAAIASPITSLNPALAAGWFAGYVQLIVAEPTAQDLADFLKLDDITLFWRNKAGRVLLVTALTNVGSMLGAWFAAAGILSAL